MNPLNAAPNSSAPLNVALVDDEPLARSRVSRLLSALGCRVVGEFEDAEELLEALAAGLRPDALFLDIEMPGASGLEALAELPAPVPVVFITAYPEHAVRAFDTTAVDYILKPVYEDRLARALERVHQHRALRTAGQTGKPVAPTPARFPARAGGGHLFLEFRKVSHFELVDGAVFAWAGGQRFRSPWDSLAEVEGTFPDAGPAAHPAQPPGAARGGDRPPQPAQWPRAGAPGRWEGAGGEPQHDPAPPGHPRPRPRPAGLSRNHPA
ncbi:MAG: response regulator [Holophagaceae bacterium]|nr:response regulator [Holophagaceae bacterium]